jgi:hypothetical protein
MRIRWERKRKAADIYDDQDGKGPAFEGIQVGARPVTYVPIGTDTGVFAGRSKVEEEWNEKPHRLGLWQGQAESTIFARVDRQ